ncbi:MAG: F0F1 ATP synthase subunit B [Lachnospiraceae bacterium]|nr:F0F1 ATP synthase subunit B [Lachnospiraceae bacterium]MBQ6967555.1 F0F1 ATP synthase subunit B [Lachnospiraceae bacterium]
METQELVTIVPWTFIAQILNLFIQMYLIKRFLFKPVNDILEKRQALTDKEIKDARTAKEDADKIREEYEGHMNGAKAEAARIISDAKKDAQFTADKMIKDAETEAHDIKVRAEADIEQEKKKAVNEAKDEISSLALDIAGKVVEKEINEADHRKLIDDFISKVGEAS